MNGKRTRAERKGSLQFLINRHSNARPHIHLIKLRFLLIKLRFLFLLVKKFDLLYGPLCPHTYQKGISVNYCTVNIALIYLYINHSLTHSLTISLTFFSCFFLSMSQIPLVSNKYVLIKISHFQSFLT